MINTLIVEDDFRVADIHARFLNQIEGIHVVGKALLAKEAEKLIEENNVELVLADIYMPDQLGIDLISDLKQKFVHLNFIVITAAQDTEFLEKSLNMGVFYYLIKPLTLSKLTEVIDQYKKRKSTLQNNETIDQDIVDNLLFKKRSEDIVDQPDLPKGINLITLNNVMEIMKNNKKGMTAREIGNLMGASRTTARRYLEYLVSKRKVEAGLEYGIVGRPERTYLYIATE